jgi:hypothetical protein
MDKVQKHNSFRTYLLVPYLSLSVVVIQVVLLSSLQSAQLVEFVSKLKSKHFYVQNHFATDSFNALKATAEKLLIIVPYK